MKEKYDVIVIGGGPAGSSAALILARSRLRVLLIDKATPRNIRARGIHGFITRHDMKPLELRRLAHEEVVKHGVRIIIDEVDDLLKVPAGFEVHVANSGIYHVPRVVIATGLVDRLPDIEGMDRFYGTSVFHCPFCDGWEVRDRPLAVIADAGKGVAIARGLLTWSADVVLCTNGARADTAARAKAAEGGIEVITEKVLRISGRRGQLERIEFESRPPLRRSAIFFDPRPEQRCAIATNLGCRTSRSGAVHTDKRQRTSIEGLYVAGDAAADPNMVAIAAADGVKAALNIVQELQRAGHWLPGSGTKRAG